MIVLKQNERNILLTVFGVVIFTMGALAQSPVPPGATVEKVTDGYQFVEGPLWREPGYLIFSDIPANTVYKWSEAGGKEVFLNPSGNSNGLAADLQGRVLLAQHGNRRIARIEEDNTEIALATHYDNKKLNSPNDIAVKSSGSIYFTDPPYGINPNQEELGFYGIYCLTPDSNLYLLDNSLSRPNGIVFSPDETKLYVNDSQARRIYVWDVQNDSTISNKQLFYTMAGSGSADGMKADADGNVYSAGPGGVWILKPDGTLLDRIAVPGQTTNLNWGDADRKTLYITSGTSVYRIRLNVNVSSVSEGAYPSIPGDIKLYDNYPNPFNPQTRIFYSLPGSGLVKLSISNLLGKHIITLVDKKQEKGEYSIIFNATGLATGIYFYQLEVGNFKATKKMLLIQ